MDEFFFDVLTGLVGTLIAASISLILAIIFRRSLFLWRRPQFDISDKIGRGRDANTNPKFRIKVVNKTPYSLVDITYKLSLVKERERLGLNGKKEVRVDFVRSIEAHKWDSEIISLAPEKKMEKKRFN